MKTFLTIQSPAEGFLREKASKFFGYAYPVQSEEDVHERLEALKKLHPKARHICYAFRLGADKSRYRYSDANEPANSAGPPIYGQIQRLDLSNVLVAVVRYFGGTKLGVGGLIQAYKATAEDALNNSQVVEDYERTRIQVEVPYARLSALMNFIKACNVFIVNEVYDDTCHITLELPADEKEALAHRLHEGMAEAKVSEVNMG